MSGLLFLLNVAAMVLVALWLWGVERSGEGGRVRIFDMQDQAAAKADASARSAPRWNRLKRGAETPPSEGRPPLASGGLRRLRRRPDLAASDPQTGADGLQGSSSPSRAERPEPGIG